MSIVEFVCVFRGAVGLAGFGLAVGVFLALFVIESKWALAGLLLLALPAAGCLMEAAFIPEDVCRAEVEP